MSCYGFTQLRKSANGEKWIEMKCENCGFENPDGNKFCESCGARLELICPKCGHSNSPDAKFCGSCGVKLQEGKPQSVEKFTIKKGGKGVAISLNRVKYEVPAMPEELTRKVESVAEKLRGSRRNVAIIFADVSGFTAMSEKLDPEEVTEKMNAVFNCLSKIIYSYEGYIDKFIGDCVMALFGAPIAHENDPLRSVLCAIDMMAAMKEFEELGLSIGINYGKVVAGGVGSDQKIEYTVMGDTVNLAQRLETAADKGEIFVNETIYNETKSEIEYKELKSIKVKGKKKLVTPYVPIFIKSRYVMRRITEIPMVGRAKELKTLIDIFNQVRSGKGQVVSILGDAGIGKSKLVYEFRIRITQMETENRKLRLGKPIWLKGRSIDYLKDSDYWSLKQILRQLIGFDETDSKEETGNTIEKFIRSFNDESLQQIIPLLKYLFSSQMSEKEIQIVEKMKADERSLILNRLLGLLFKKVSKNKAVIMVFEDLHWVDTSTLSFIKNFIKEIENSNVMMALIFRPELTENKSYISEFSHSNQIKLNPLTKSQSNKLIQKIIVSDTVDISLKGLIFERSNGNPFYIEQLVELLLNEKMIDLDNNKAKLKSGNFDRIPVKLNELILAKVDKLDKDIKQIVLVASVIGREFSTRVLETIIEIGAELRTALKIVEKKNLIYKITRDIEESLKGADRYKFKNIIIRNTIYDSILKAERKRYHKQVGETIEQIHKDNLDNYLDILIYHFRKGEDRDRLLKYLQMLGEKQDKAGDYKKAEQLYEEWIISRAPEHQGIRAQVKYIEINIKLAGVKDSLAKYDEGLEILDRIEDKEEEQMKGELLARLFLQRGGILQSKGEYDRALNFAKEAENVLKDIIAPLDSISLDSKHLTALIGDCYNNIGGVYYYKGNYDNALKYYNKSLNMRLKTLGDEHPDVAASFNNIGLVYHKKGDYDNALKYYQKTLKIELKTLGDEHPDVAASYNTIGLVCREKGNYDNALKYYNKSLNIRLKTLGYEHPDVGMSYNNIGIVYDYKGNYDSALRYHNKSLNIWLKILGDEHPLVGSSYNNIGAIYRNKADYDSALKYYNKSMDILLKIYGDEHPNVATNYNNIGDVYCEKGDYDSALKYYNKSLNILLKALGDEHPSVGLIYNNIGDVYCEKGDYDSALKYYNKSMGIWSKTLGNKHLYIAYSYMGLGDVCLNTNKYKQALEWFKKALEIHLEKLGMAHPETAETKFKMAKTLIKSSTHEMSLNVVLRYLKEAIKVGKKNKSKWLTEAINLLKEIGK